MLVAAYLARSNETAYAGLDASGAPDVLDVLESGWYVDGQRVTG